MTYTPSPSPRRHSPDAVDAPGSAGDSLSQRDTIKLLQIMSVVGGTRHDPKQWRSELLSGLLDLLLPAGTPRLPGDQGAAVALVVKSMDSAPIVVSLIEEGLSGQEQKLALRQEFMTAPFNDLFSRFAVEKFARQGLGTLTCLRSDLVDDATWQGHVSSRTLRQKTGLEDCMLSLHRSSAGAEGLTYAIYAYRPASADPANPAAARKFGHRDRLLLDTLQRGLEGLYRAEESTQRLDPATGLRPRVRQALDYLIAGDTERQVALKMSISVHTVHDYVKSLYTHFGVSSRNELLARWVQSGGQLPPRQE